MAAVIVAAVGAAIIAVVEQSSQFGIHNVPFAHRAWAWWLFRIVIEVAAALAVLGLFDAAELDAVTHWWGGLIAALVGSAGLRSSVLEVPGEAYGARRIFDPLRDFITTRLRIIAAAATTSHVVDEVLPAVEASTLTPTDIAERLRVFVTATETLSRVDRDEELRWIDETAGDEATDPQIRTSALIEKALELGGHELVDQIRRQATDDRT